MNPEARKYLASIGSKGGKATGVSKRRGSAAYYKRISKLAAKARKAKSGNGELTDAGPKTPASRETQSRHSVQ